MTLLPQPQVVMLGSKHLWLLSHPTSPLTVPETRTVLFTSALPAPLSCPSVGELGGQAHAPDSDFLWVLES